MTYKIPVFNSWKPDVLNCVNFSSVCFLDVSVEQLDFTVLHLYKKWCFHFCRVFCFNFLEDQERILLTQEEGIFVQRSTFSSVVILVLANPSCSSMCITWFLEASIRLAKGQVQLVLLHMWWKIQKHDSWFFRQVLWYLVTMAFAALMSLIKWMKARGQFYTKWWNNRHSPLQR